VIKPLFFTPVDGRYGFDLTGFQQVITDLPGLDTMLEKILNKEETVLLIIDERLLDINIEKKLIRMRNYYQPLEIIMIEDTIQQLSMEYINADEMSEEADELLGRALWIIEKLYRENYSLKGRINKLTMLKLAKDTPPRKK